MDLVRVERLIDEISNIKLLIDKVGITPAIERVARNHRQALKEAIEIHGSDGVAYEVGDRTFPQIIEMVNDYKQEIGMA